MILLKEQTFDIDVEILAEQAGGPKSYFISGPFLVAETQNKNRRIYPKSILEREVEKYQELIRERRALSELGHPETPNVNLERASHLITHLKFNGNIAEGRAKIMDTPMGKIAKTFLDEGVKLGVSSRGVGSLKLVEGYNLVQDDYKMSAIDIVSDPSGPGCFVEGIMESAQWVLDAASGNWKLVEGIKHEIRKASKSQLESVILTSFEKFIKSL